MRLHRFYISQTISENKSILIDSANLVNQILNVFRMKIGDSVILFDGSGFDFICKINTINKNEINLDITEKISSRYNPQNEIHLYVAIIKKDKFEWVVEKAAELGVTHIHPMLTERSEKKDINVDRLKKISIEASEQSGRGDIPKIFDPVKFDTKIFDKNNFQIAFHIEGKNFNKSVIPNNQSISIYIGPEGGWSEKEITMFHDNLINYYCLGKQILKTETACVIAISLISLS